MAPAVGARAVAGREALVDAVEADPHAGDQAQPPGLEIGVDRTRGLLDEAELAEHGGREQRGALGLGDALDVVAVAVPGGLDLGERVARRREDGGDGDEQGGGAHHRRNGLPPTKR